MFPEGLLIDVKNRVHLTRKVNIVFGLTHKLSNSCEDKTEKPLISQGLFTDLVAGAGFEPTTFGL